MNSRFNSIEEGIKALQQGKMVILTDDESRENEGDLIIPAQNITAKDINFMCHHARGLICLPMQDADFQRLKIPMMTDKNQSTHNTAFGVSFEAAQGTSTGISAHDRALSIKAAVNEKNGENGEDGHGHIDDSDEL